MKPANGVEEGNFSLEPTLFTHQLGSSQPGGAGGVGRLVPESVVAQVSDFRDSRRGWGLLGDPGALSGTQVRSWSPGLVRLLGSSGRPVWEALPALSRL